MTSLNLFDEPIDEPTPADRYADYIASAKWKRRCEIAIARAGGKCQHCGFSKYSRRLEVHHLTYERLGHEDDNDIVVLCHECHQRADEQRKAEEARQQEERRQNGPMAAGFEAWMDRGNNYGWRNWKATYIQRSWEDFVDHVNRLRHSTYKAGRCPLLR